MVSVIFSNDIGFCLNTTLPFLISTPLCFVCSPTGKLPVASVPHDYDGDTYWWAEAGRELYLFLSINRRAYSDI